MRLLTNICRQVHKQVSPFLNVSRLVTNTARCLTLTTEGLDPKEANRRLRIELAAAHRGLADYGFSDRVFNHLSVKAPAADGKGEVMLITPFPYDFADVTPSCLLGIDSEGDVVEGDGSLHQISGSFHRGFFISCPDKKSMMHTHSPYISVLACLEDPTIKMINQTSVMVYKQIGYDMEYGGVVNDLDEGKRLGSLMGSDLSALVLAHHGAVSAGKTVGQAFFFMVALELSAEMQIKAWQTGQKITEIKRDVLEKTNETMRLPFYQPLLDCHLASIITKLARDKPEFKYE